MGMRRNLLLERRPLSAGLESRYYSGAFNRRRALQNRGDSGETKLSLRSRRNACAVVGDLHSVAHELLARPRSYVLLFLALLARLTFGFPEISNWNFTGPR